MRQTILPHQYNLGQNVYKKFISLTLCWIVSLCMEPLLKCGWYTEWDLFGETIFYLQVSTNYRHFLCQGSGPMSNSPSQCLDLVWFDSVQSQSMLVHKCTIPVVSGCQSWNYTLFWILQFLPFLLNNYLSPEKMSWMKTLYLGLSSQSTSFSVQLWVSFSVSFPICCNKNLVL